MRISARVSNTTDRHRTSVSTDGKEQLIEVPARTTGRGSAINGGEFLMLALATCYCNDIYREAARRNVAVEAVEVEAQADFTGVGMAASNISYHARVTSTAPPAEIDALLDETDAVAEVHNTLRAGARVVRRAWPK